MVNKWKLYSTVDGWQFVEKRLDRALAVTLRAVDQQIAAGANVIDATSAGVIRMIRIMGRPTNMSFGAINVEPREYLALAFSNHIRRKHGINLTISRYGDVYDLN